jgi:hypothetical protein
LQFLFKYTNCIYKIYSRIWFGPVNSNFHFEDCSCGTNFTQIFIPLKSTLINRHVATRTLSNNIINTNYYIDRCELWGFILEINSGISHVKYQFFSHGTTFTQLQVWWLRPLLCYGEYTYHCRLKKFHEMSLTTLTHNQNDVIDVIWKLPVWNVKIRRYLALCTFQFWSNLTKISFQGKHFNYLCALL